MPHPHEDRLFGLIVTHQCVDGPYVGTASFSPGSHCLLSEEPLTITPSLVCPECGDHGWIRDGAWVSC